MNTTKICGILKATQEKGGAYMCTAQQLNDLTADLVSEYRSLFGNSLRQVILYGSYARGDFDEESDVDVAALVDCPRETLHKAFEQLGEISSELSLTYGITVSPTAIPFADFQNYQDALPYYRNIHDEGVQLFA